MKLAIIIQTKSLKNALTGIPVLREQGFTYNPRYQEFYKLFNTAEDFNAEQLKLTELVLYPNCIEEGNYEALEEIIKELQP